MTKIDWVKEAPFAVTVIDSEGVILEMNDKSATTFEKDGGRELIGKSVLDCHPETARGKVQELLRSGDSNIYTIEKNGVKKIIVQAPWRSGGKQAGVVELSIELPADMPHFIRE